MFARRTGLFFSVKQSKHPNHSPLTVMWNWVGVYKFSTEVPTPLPPSSWNHSVALYWNGCGYMEIVKSSVLLPGGIGQPHITATPSQITCHKVLYSFYLGK